VPRRGLARTACILALGLALGYGLWRGGNAERIGEALRIAGDAAANAGGFRIATVALSGTTQVTREEILALAGVTGRSSLLFLNVEAARRKLKTNPWIGDATVLKLYPDRLQIGIKERRPFALWQVDRRVAVIADDGTVLEPYVARRFVGLPFVVGRGAQFRARDLVALLGRVPSIREEVLVSVLVAQRRWNLHLKNGVEVRLPEEGAEAALARLLRLDQEKQLLSRDIVAVDLRLPDRVAVRLSEEAANARAEALQPKKRKRKGGSA
jgi:cell division protein FtsQ